MEPESASARYSVLIIGAGKIGAFFDTPQKDVVLTHAHAFSSHPGFILKGFFDANYGEAAKAAKLWGGKAFQSLDEAFSIEQVDVAIVASPDETHNQILRDLAKRPIKLVFAEKPLAISRDDAQSIVDIYRANCISLGVNYSRRFVPAFRTLRKAISDGDFGQYLRGTGYYGKGTKHNGSHMIDLLLFLVGEPLNVKSFARIADWREDDPTCSAIFEMNFGSLFILQGVDCRSYTIFEMDLLFEKARICIINSGFAIERFEVVDSEMFSGYKVLSTPKTEVTEMAEALSNAATNIYEHLSTPKPLFCTGEDGSRVIAICDRLLGGSA